MKVPRFFRDYARKTLLAPAAHTTQRSTIVVDVEALRLIVLEET